jgi:hypothetical protein
MISRAEAHFALNEERAELSALADAVETSAPVVRALLCRARLSLAGAWSGVAHPLIREQALETFARDLRHAWLTSAAEATSKNLRSPTEAEPTVSQTGRPHQFGYERDLRPEELEQKCDNFFAPPSEPWCSEHLMFSSGQAAMTASLILMDGEPRLVRPRRPIRVAHQGAYFETTALLRLLPSLIKSVDVDADFDAAIVEPIWCDGNFGSVDMGRLARQLSRPGLGPRTIILDSTLRGRHDSVADFLANIRAPQPVFVFRVNSGLKLFQSGMELANVGILSVFGQDRATVQELAERLRGIRTLLDSGLRFADVAALEFPTFLDPTATLRYESAIFEHNAMVARAVADNNRIFQPVTHPSLGPGGTDAPYCVFRLKTESFSAYDRLENTIHAQARAKSLLFSRGGSFGFRSHRFEVVRPDGDAPFLRVAMGRRPGWSRAGITDLLRAIAFGSVSIEDQRTCPHGDA